MTISCSQPQQRPLNLHCPVFQRGIGALTLADRKSDPLTLNSLEALQLKEASRDPEV